MRRSVIAIFSMMLSLLACTAERPVAKDSTTATDTSVNPWSPTAVTRGREVRRVVVYRNGWNRGNEALLLSDADAARLYELLAGNEQMQYMCGYHWSFAFEYADGTVEEQPINEECEKFRRHHDEIWKLMTSLWTRAAASPTHRTFRAELQKDASLDSATAEVRAAGCVVLERFEGSPAALVTACEASADLAVVGAIAGVEIFNEAAPVR